MVTKERSNIIATYGTAKTYLGFYGHMDTVPPDVHYTQDPFTILRKGTRAHGLGVADMKGGLAAILRLAAVAAAEQLPVKLVFGVDEENISLGAHALVDQSMLNDVDFLISGESGQVKNERQGYSVCFGRRGRIAIKVTVRGKKAHAAESQKAVNAIEMAGRLITHLDQLSFAHNPHFGTTNLVIHEISGSTDSFSVPDECSFMLSALTAPPTRHTEVIHQLSSLAKKLGVQADIMPLSRPTPYGDSYEVSQSNAFLQRIQKEVFVADSVVPAYVESIADENIFANRLGIPVISVGPIGGGDHTAYEWVDVRSIDNVAACYAKILRLYTS
jgi:acetylornithine deacetylase/succinyl-diaminopimelate desuccinylase-like protein